MQALWFFTSDLVFVLLFPQLIFALFDPKANRTGSIVAFVVSFVLRVGGGEPLLGLPAFMAYPDDAAVQDRGRSAGLILLPLVSRADRPVGSAAAAAQRRHPGREPRSAKA